ncbi:GTP-binding protein [Pseudomonas rubra]|uniref:GTP-binding protein n=1 Tax=Pseudomonas rubra TaxID=2942627 RepID=A0ABT5PF47_9PSED|nr:GTP-binding protein [Pseudomonas rubra]MDD1016822.1 GTP-binding protein [Pseudomonas rubra]MDD1041461.1 GTP-binding protein [Pseudomonas rubra]MDD1154966.1 GTP-binding protein [Pseudomonas rubra]
MHSSKATQRRIHICTIGQNDHGKTTLTAALSGLSVEAVNDAAVKSVNGVGISFSRVEYESNSRHYIHMDFPRYIDYETSMITGAPRMDGAILVCSATQGPTPQTRDHVLLCQMLGIHHIVVFLNKADLLGDDGVPPAIEASIRELLTDYGFPGDDTPMIIGSARMALESQDVNGMGGSAIRKLQALLDAYIPEPVSAVDPLHRKFNAFVYVLSKGEGGRGTALLKSETDAAREN